MTILNRWFEEVWNQGRESAIDEILYPGATVHGLTGADGNPAEDIQSFKALYRAFHAAFSDIHVEVEESIQQGDICAVRCVVTATHTGEGLGKLPKGNPITFTGMCFVRVKDGRIIEGWNNFDFATMFQQMD
jgi:predicted ester cyclase